MRTYREMTHVILADASGNTELAVMDLADRTFDELEGELRRALRTQAAGALSGEEMEAAIDEVKGAVMTNEAIPGAREDRPIVTTAEAGWREGATLRVERRLEIQF